MDTEPEVKKLECPCCQQLVPVIANHMSCSNEACMIKGIPVLVIDLSA